MTGKLSSRARPGIQGYTETGLRSFLPVDLRLQCGREFIQRDTRTRPAAALRTFNAVLKVAHPFVFQFSIPLMNGRL